MARRTASDEPDHWFGSRGTTIALALMAALVVALVQQLVYPAFSWNRDEPVYLWQVELLRSGQLTSTDAGFPELLQPWLSAWRDGAFFAQYPLGWPLVIFVGSLVGWPGFAVSVAAVLAVTGVAALALAIGYDRVVANTASLVLLCSPIFVVQGGLYLTYLFTLGLGLWFLTGFVLAVTRRSAIHAAASGVAFGWIVCTRTFDAVLWGAVAVGWAILSERGAVRRHLRTAAWFLAALAPFVVLQALHNRHLTGSVLSFPITAKDPLDTFGFGHRRLMPALEAEGYGLRRATVSTLKHGFFFPWFLFGTYLGVVVAAAAAWVGRRDRATWLLVAVAAIFPVGYFVFWGTYVSSLTVRLSGPIYFVPLYAPLSILIAWAGVQLLRRRPRQALALFLVLMCVTIPVTVGRLGLNRELSRAQVAWRDSSEELDEPAVVVVAATAYLLYLNPYAANAPEVEDGAIIYATNRWPTVIELLDQYPDRAHYLQRATITPEEMLPSERPRRPEVVLTPIERVTGDAVELELRIVPPRTGEEVWVQVEVDGGMRWRRITFDSTADEPITTTITLLAPGRDPTSDSQVVIPRGLDTVTVGVAFGSATRYTTMTPVVRHRLHVRGTDRIEVVTPGVSARGRGEEVRFPDRWDELLSVPELEVTVSSRR